MRGGRSRIGAHENAVAGPHSIRDSGGGVLGYQDLLEILFDPTHGEFENSRVWVGPAFDLERFDRRRVNEELERR